MRAMNRFRPASTGTEGSAAAACLRWFAAPLLAADLSPACPVHCTARMLVKMLGSRGAGNEDTFKLVLSRSFFYELQRQG